MVRFQVLGDVAASSDDGPVPLGSARQRAVLAVLLVEPGAVVSHDQLADRVWGTQPPRNARRTVHTYISRLRSALAAVGGPRLDRRSGGYALAADESAVDLHRFRDLVAEARRADDDRAAALWQEALGLWRGEPFAGVDSDWLRSVAVTLEAERLSAVLDHNEALLRAGQHARLLPSIADATRTRPLDERLAAQYLLTLYRCGRQAEALERYGHLRERLGEELGAEPGPALRDLHQRILRHDPELTARADAPVTDLGPAADATARRPRPAQLPLDVSGFTGRDDDLQGLDQLVSGRAQTGSDSPVRAVVITAISGTAGVGKTALAVHWAHRVSDQFPDGQLYVNLRGYDPDQPIRPSDALARFLIVLGVPERDIPLDDDARAARYRSELAGRSMLIVLDNAASVAQVRPLLPGGGSSLVVVTSRDSLAGLVALHGAHQVLLDLLSPGEAVGLLHRLIGDRVAAEPEAAAALAEQCVRLPLALRVAAVLATSRPDSPLADVVAELSDLHERLDLLDPGGDPYAAVHAVFSWSIQHLPEQAAGMFRRLGLHPGPDLDPYVAAALTGLEPGIARRTLELLVSAHLLHRTGPGRYGMHDLLRAYSVRLGAAQDTGEEREGAENRLLGYYQSAAFAAVNSLYPAEVRYQLDPALSHTAIPDLSAPGQARDWLRAERFCLAAVAEYAADRLRSDYVIGLARILHRYVNTVSSVELSVVNTHALRAAEATGDLNGQAHALRQLALVSARTSQHETAVGRHRRALALFRRTADTAGEALTLTTLATVEGRRGYHRRALRQHLRAVDLARLAGDRYVEAGVLTNLAITRTRLGHTAEALDAGRRALAIYRGLGTLYSEAVTLNTLANAEMGREHYASAGEHLRRALDVAEELDIVVMKAYVLDSLGLLHLRLEEPQQATECFQQALAHNRQIGDHNGQAWAINGLGEAAQLAGRPASAMAFHTQALAIAAEVDGHQQQARAHAGIGHAHRTMRSTDQARTHYERAHVIYAELGMPEADEMRAHLGDLHEASAQAEAM
jgi:DNA-binding SARP family transcriptional activator